MMKCFYIFLCIFNAVCFASQEVKLYQWPNDDRPMYIDTQVGMAVQRAKIPLLLNHCPEDDVCQKLVSDLNLSWRSSLYSIYVYIAGQSLGKKSPRWRCFDEVCGCLIMDDFIQHGDLKNVDNYLKEVAAAEKAIAKVKSHQKDEVFPGMDKSLCQRWMFFNEAMSKLPSYADQLNRLVVSGALHRLPLEPVDEGGHGQDVISSVPIIGEEEKSGLEKEIQQLSTRIMFVEQEIGKRNSPLRNCLYALGVGVMAGIGFVAVLYIRMQIMLAQSV